MQCTGYLTTNSDLNSLPVPCPSIPRFDGGIFTHILALAGVAVPSLTGVVVYTAVRVDPDGDGLGRGRSGRLVSSVRVPVVMCRPGQHWRDGQQDGGCNRNFAKYHAITCGICSSGASGAASAARFSSEI